MTISISGYSDDAIILQGDIQEQFDCYEAGDVVRFLAFSDGTLLRITYGVNKEAAWRITRMKAGSSSYSLQQAVLGQVDKEYSDKATLADIPPIQWVLCSKTPPAFPKLAK